MENSIQVFENSEFGSVRTIEEDGKILFCGSDVAKALGYARPRDAIRDHCDHAVKRRMVSTTTNQHGTTTEQEVEASFIPESDLYKLAFGSKLSSAQKFTDWVTSDVLPTIRKHGAYMTPETLEAAVLNPDSLLKIALRLKEETDKRKALEAKVEEDRPKLDYYNEILHWENAILVTAIAKDYGMSAAAFNKKLNELGIQYKRGGTWFLYDRYADQGYTRSETYKYTNGEGCDCANISTRWTQKGRLFLYEQLKAVGIVPVVEAA